MAKDNINPPHYKNKSIETIEAIKSQLTEAEFIGYLKGTIMKYISRMGLKVPTLEGAREDVAKAHWFIEYLLKTLTDLINKRKKKDPSKDQPGTVIKLRKDKDNDTNK
jgi:hypothetical protein